MKQKLSPIILILFSLILISCDSNTTSTVSAPPKSREQSAPHLIEATVVNLEPITMTVTYTGSLRARRILKVFTQESGKIIKFPYYEGDKINQGQVLVQLDDALLKTELDKLTAQYQQALTNTKRSQKLAPKKLITEDELTRTKTTLQVAQAEKDILRIRLSYAKIIAPFNGIVSERLAELGDVVSSNTHVMTIIDPKSLIIDLLVPERMLAQLKIKDEVAVRIDAIGRQTFVGKIIRIHPSIDKQTRLGQIEIKLNTLPQAAKAGQLVRVTIEKQTTPRLTLPYIALRRDHQGEYVFTINNEQKVQRQNVESGLRAKDNVEILQGLQQGQLVVTKGFLGLRENKTVELLNNQNVK